MIRKDEGIRLHLPADGSSSESPSRRDMDSCSSQQMEAVHGSVPSGRRGKHLVLVVIRLSWSIEVGG